MHEKELRELLKKGENEYVEFKPFGEFNREPEIGKQLVAFANLDGGKLIFGVNNDGEILGDNVNFDEKANKIVNIARNSCTPQIQFSDIRFPLSEGDVYVVLIEKRKDIPHAYNFTKNFNRKGYSDSITGRAYYVKTISGVRLVDDKELEWLFRTSQDYNFDYQFNTGIRIGFSVAPKNVTFFIKDLMLNIPPGQIFYEEYLNLFKDEFITSLKRGTRKEIMDKKVGIYLFELLPFVFLKGLANCFKDTYDIEISREYPIITHSKDIQLPTTKIPIEKIKLLDKCAVKKINKLLDKSSDEIKLNNLILPKDTKITLDFKYKEDIIEKIQLKLDNKKAFNFIVTFQPIKWKYGDYYQRIKMFQFVENIGILNVNIKVKGKLFFTRETNEYFENINQFINNLHRLIKLYWDTDFNSHRFLEEKILRLDSKINSISYEIKDLKWEIENIMNKVDNLK